MIVVEVFELSSGQFAVAAHGQYQPHDPDLEGFVPMSLERAGAVAEALREALEAI